MKKFFIVSALALFSSSAFAEAPKQTMYQGQLSATDLQVILAALQTASHACGDSDTDQRSCQIGMVAPTVRKDLSEFKPVSDKK